MIRGEFDAIWRAQAPHHSELLDARTARRDRARCCFASAISSRPRSANARLFPARSGLPKALPSVEAREVYERLAHIRISQGAAHERALTPEERDALASVLLDEGKMTYREDAQGAQARRRCAHQFRGIWRNGDQGLVSPASLLSKVASIIGARWLADVMGRRRTPSSAKLLDEADEATLVARLVREDGLERGDGDANARDDRPLADGYSRLGRRPTRRF